MRGMRPPDSRLTRRRTLVLALSAAGSLFLAAPARAAYVVRPWPADKPVPALELSDLDGKPWRLGALAGKVVVLNFWATWCEPCRAEMPSLQTLAARHRDAGLVVVAVNYREPAALVRSFLERTPFAATVLLDADGDAASQWTPHVFPSTVLIGRDGRPASMVLGDLDWSGQAARALVEPLLAAPRKR
jgi:thiol-disulfide isomerase/thioredoxin